jgi:hypothetical protein
MALAQAGDLRLSSAPSSLMAAHVQRAPPDEGEWLSIGGAAFAVQFASRLASTPRKPAAEAKRALATKPPRSLKPLVPKPAALPPRRLSSLVMPDARDTDSSSTGDEKHEGKHEEERSEEEQPEYIHLVSDEESDTDSQEAPPNRLFMSGHAGLGEDLMGTYDLCEGRGFNGRPKCAPCFFRMYIRCLGFRGKHSWPFVVECV